MYPCVCMELHASIYISRDLILESIKLCYVAHSLKLVINQQSLHLYQSISSLKLANRVNAYINYL